MTTNPISQRLPTFDLSTEEGRQQAHRYNASGIVDLNQAIKAIKDQVTALQTAQAAAATSSTASSSVTTAQATQIATTQAMAAIASTFGTVNNQTGTAYTVQQSDYGGIVTFDNASPVAVTLNNGMTTTVSTNWWSFLQNNGAGTVTLTPASGNINGNANLALATAQSAAVFFDGTNWWAATSTAGGGGTITDVVAGTGLNGGGSSGSVTLNLDTPVSVADGGTGTATPGLVAGTGISITGSWPDQTITNTGGGGGYLKGTVTINFTSTSGTFTGTATVTGATTSMGAIMCDPTASFGISPQTPLYQQKGAYVSSTNNVFCTATISGFASPPGNVTFNVVVFA